MYPLVVYFWNHTYVCINICYNTKGKSYYNESINVFIIMIVTMLGNNFKKTQMDEQESVYLVKEYNYTFKVLPVDQCPMNESGWQAAASRTGCNDTNVYHCAPDKFHSSLIEFCYYKKPNLVEKGTYLNVVFK